MAAAAGSTGVTQLTLQWRPFALTLPQPLRTAQGVIERRQGWLLRLEDAQGHLGWGEAAPLELVAPPSAAATPGANPPAGAHATLAAAITRLGPHQPRQALEQQIPQLPGPLAFALGAALAELEGLIGGSGGWQSSPHSAWLLPAGAAALPALDQALKQTKTTTSQPGPGALPFTVKWKVAAGDDAQERALLEVLLQRLPAGARLRLDANGGWNRPQASAWADRLAGNTTLEWLEQPLPAHDLCGLKALAQRLPVALDETLALQPALRQSWPGWQVRRPVLEGDPRPLLADLQRGCPHRMLSTAFETGIGRRWLEHLAAVQQQGPGATAAGLAPGWQAPGALAARDPQQVWEGARCNR